MKSKKHIAIAVAAVAIIVVAAVMIATPLDGLKSHLRRLCKKR